MNRVALLAPAVLCLVLACHTGKPGEDGQTRQLTVGIQNSPSNALVIIASRLHFFDSTKATISIKEFSAGKLALQSMLGQAGDLDVAVCAETPVVLSSLGNNKFKVFTQIVRANNECRVVVRKDKKADSPGAYFSTKRKLATSQGGSPEWFTYEFIKKFNLDAGKIDIIAMLPENMPVALSNGAVDGISIFDPYARIGERELGDKGLTFTNPDIVSYYVMTARENVLTAKEDAFEELLTGLAKAQDYCKVHPAEAMQIVADQTHLDIGIVRETWPNYSFSLGLDSSFTGLCREEAGWAIATGKYPQGTALPDFGALLYLSLLQKKGIH